ncbi:MAG: prepilin-type N-terminal cleavage/methylation domain-containing protein [Phycisphaerales bacterium JB052]
MTLRSASTRKAFTLLELLVTVLLMGIISAVLLPVISSASEAYSTTRDVRARSEHIAHALDRVARVIRQAPIGTDDEGLGVVNASVSTFELSDGTGFELNGSSVEILVPGQPNAILCEDVDDLVIQYIAEDGITNTLADPVNAHRVVVTITSGDLSMSVVAHPRVWIGQGAS